MESPGDHTAGYNCSDLYTYRLWAELIGIKLELCYVFHVSSVYCFSFEDKTHHVEVGVELPACAYRHAGLKMLLLLMCNLQSADNESHSSLDIIMLQEYKEFVAALSICCLMR